MQNYVSKLALAVAGAALLAGASSVSASAATQNGYSYRYSHLHHRPVAHHAYYRSYGSDVTVRKSVARPQVATAPDAFHGPAPIITAPIEMAGTIVSLPFRAVEVIFPPRANDPRMVVGAPVHFASQIAESPFYFINSAFGVRPTYYNFN